MIASVCNSDLRRVTKREPCPICQRKDWCEIRVDGAVLCQRVKSDRPCKTRSGWWHNLPGQDRLGVRPSPAPAAPKPARADNEICHAVYTALLDTCPLTPADRTFLEGQGMPASVLGDFGTLPARPLHGPIMAGLVTQFGRGLLLTVPGIVPNGEGLHLTFSGGLLVACRGQDGQITALQVRTEDRTGKKCYRWLSGGSGPSSGAPAHVARPEGAPTHTIVITEGVKKAIIAADRLGLIAIGLPGHQTQTDGLAVLAYLAEQGALCVHIALDEDTNPETAALVDASRRKIAASALALGLAVRYQRWDNTQGKGIDDLLTAGYALRQEVVTESMLGADAGGSTEAQGGRWSLAKEDRLAELEAQQRMVKNVLLSRNLSDPENPAAAADPHQKLSLLLTYMLCGYPGKPTAQEGTVVSISAMATFAGMTRQTLSSKLKSLHDAGLIRRETETVAGEDGKHRSITRITPLRALGFNEVLQPTKHIAVERERAAQRRACSSCGSELVNVASVKMEKLTCTSCGTVTTERPPAERAYQRAASYAKREREREDVAYMAEVVAESEQIAEADGEVQVMTAEVHRGSVVTPVETPANVGNRGNYVTPTSKQGESENATPTNTPCLDYGVNYVTSVAAVAAHRHGLRQPPPDPTDRWLVYGDPDDF